MPNMVTVVDSNGSRTQVPSDQLGEAARQGFHIENPDEASGRVTEGVESERYGGLPGAIVAGGAALARGASLGTSDAAIAALGGGHALQKLQQYNPIVSTVGSIVGAGAGAIASGGASLEGEAAGLLARSPAAAVARLGSGIAERAGGGIISGVKAGIAEGGLYGAGNAVSELALSNDPLTAEHIASTLSSNVLMGAGLGGVTGGVFKAGERALSRAGDALGEATAARAAVDGVPEDLAGLDAKGLREAAATERASLKTAADTERASLEQARVPQRQQLAEDIKALHDTLANEAPIYKSVQGADVANIEGIKDARVQLAKSNSYMRGALDSPLSVARDPSSLIRPLEMRQTALEAIQSKAPELMETLGGDSRSLALRHVDDALAETKSQIAQIRDLAPRNPVTSAKLTDLESGASPRLTAIEAAKDALANAPGKGIIQKGAEGAAFAGGTALAHMIPGVGIASPFVGKYAADTVGRLFSRLAEHGAASAAGTDAAARAFLSTAKGAAIKASEAAPMVATKVLGAVRFAPGAEETPRDLPSLFKARSAEIRSQTQYMPDGSVQMRPDARAQMAARLDPIASVNPLLADKIETTAAARVAFISSKIPRRPDIDGIQIGPDNWQPSDAQMRSWARSIQAAEDPAGVEKRLAAGIVTPEDSEAYRTVYPQRFAAMQQMLMREAPTLAKSLPLQKRIAWTIFSGVPIDASMAPNVLTVLQGQYTRPAPDPTAQIPGMQAPKIKPNYGTLGSMKSLDKPTPAQSRGQG